MKKHFYHHIVEIDSLFVELDDLKLGDHEREHLSKLVDANLHHSVLDVILSQLTEEDKKLFMEHLDDNDHDRIWELLHLRTRSIEDKIRDIAEEVKKELHEDIREAKKVRGGST